ncbi:MAG: hypothetical protein JW841_16695 [Deltaproteobacteria bacterium]|nr:hypothetical protein [Deltaproteobacteria bacterium]
MYSTKTLMRLDDVAVFQIENCVVSVWERTPTVEHIDKVDQFLNEVTRDYPKGIGNINITMGRGQHAITAETKAKIQKLILKYQGKIIAVAHIILASGMIGAIISSFFALIAIIKNDANTPMRIFRESAEAAEWIAAKIGLDAQALEYELNTIICNFKMPE